MRRVDVMSVDHLQVLASLVFMPSVLVCLVVLGILAVWGARWLIASGRVSASFGLTWITLATAGFVISVTLMRFGVPSDGNPSGQLQLRFYPSGLFSWTSEGLIRFTENPFTRPDIWLNVLLYVPLGFFVCLLTGRFRRTVLAVALSTLAIELLQGLFALGSPDLGDVLTNLIGGVTGAVLAVFLTAALPLAGKPRRPRRHLFAALGGTAAFVSLAVLGAPVMADRVQDHVAAELRQRYSHASVQSWNDWQAAGPMAVEANVPAVGSRRIDGQLSTPVPTVRWPTTILGVPRCVIAEFLADSVRITEDTGATCTESMVQ